MAETTQSSRSWAKFSDTNYYQETRGYKSLHSLDLKKKGHVDCAYDTLRLYTVNNLNLGFLQLRLSIHPEDRLTLNEVNADIGFSQDRENGPSINYFGPPTVTGTPQQRHVSDHWSFEPHVPVPPIGEVSLGNVGRSSEGDRKTSWKFQCVRKSFNTNDGSYNKLLLSWQAEERSSLESFARRAIVAAAVLEDLSNKLTVTTTVTAKAKSWIERLRVFRSLRTLPSAPTKRDIQISQPSLTDYGSEEDFRQAVKFRIICQNLDSVPMALPDNQDPQAAITAMQSPPKNDNTITSQSQTSAQSARQPVTAARAAPQSAATTTTAPQPAAATRAALQRATTARPQPAVAGTASSASDG